MERRNDNPNGQVGPECPDLDALEALLDTTRGEWAVSVAAGNVELTSGPAPTDCMAILRSPRPVRLFGDFDAAVKDAQMLASIRNAAPALIAEVRRLREALQRLGNYEAFAQTYLGGYQTSEEIETFQHGMSTVCSAARAELEAAKRSFAGEVPAQKETES